MKALVFSVLVIFGACSSKPKKMEKMPAESPVKMVSKTVNETKAEANPAPKPAPKPVAKTAMAEASTGDKITTCSYGENKRIIENRHTDKGGCEVVYTKDGDSNTIATAINELDYCQEVYDRVAGKLANAGFNCE